MLSCVRTGPHSESDPRSQSSHFYSSEEVDEVNFPRLTRGFNSIPFDPLAL